MKSEKATLLHLEELLYKKILSADGKKVGHIFDVQLSRDGKHRVTALMYGQNSLLFRLHVFEPVVRAFHLEQKPKTIPWEAVEHVDSAAVRLKSGYNMKGGT